LKNIEDFRWETDGVGDKRRDFAVARGGKEALTFNWLRPIQQRASTTAYQSRTNKQVALSYMDKNITKNENPQ
jgi:hypothetical protein